VTFFARETFPKEKRAKKKGTAPRLLFYFAGKGWPCAAGLRFRREIAPGGILCRFFVPFYLGSFYIPYNPRSYKYWVISECFPSKYE
jgi:hypothetical protein